MHLLLVALLLAPTQRELTPPANAALAAELRTMAEEDKALRERWTKDQQNQALREEVRAADAKHAARLDQIIAAHGWPGISLVGFNGMNDAWLIAQHGGRDYVPRVLPLMYEAVLKGELDESLYGTSLDRVLTFQNKPQLYGTQFKAGSCEPYPIDDPANVDARRKRAGMPPLAEYTKQLCEIFGAK
ncbi:MAG TPA: DUF6624 domain-containing protein [Thermoanaerobaculia bacterium]